MEIKCPKCGKVHQHYFNRIVGWKEYLECSKCGFKILVREVTND